MKNFSHDEILTVHVGRFDDSIHNAIRLRPDILGNLNDAVRYSTKVSEYHQLFAGFYQR